MHWRPALAVQIDSLLTRSLARLVYLRCPLVTRLHWPCPFSGQGTQSSGFRGSASALEARDWALLKNAVGRLCLLGEKAGLLLRSGSACVCICICSDNAGLKDRPGLPIIAFVQTLASGRFPFFCTRPWHAAAGPAAALGADTSLITVGSPSIHSASLPPPSSFSFPLSVHGAFEEEQIYNASRCHESDSRSDKQ